MAKKKAHMTAGAARRAESHADRSGQQPQMQARGQRAAAAA